MVNFIKKFVSTKYVGSVGWVGGEGDNQHILQTIVTSRWGFNKGGGNMYESAENQHKFGILNGDDIDY